MSLLKKTQPTLNAIQGISINGLPTSILNLLTFDSVNNQLIWSTAASLGLSAKQMFGGNIGSVGTSTIRFLNPFGNQSNEDLESEAEILITSDGTIKNLRAKYDTNSLNGNSVLTVRKNRANTTLTVTIPTTATDEVTDLVNEFSVVAGDRICTQINNVAATGGSGLNLKSSYEIEFV